MGNKSRVAVVLQRNLASALRRRDLAEAATVLEHLKREDPLSVETRGLELEYVLEAGRLDEAVSLSPQLIELFPASPRIHYLAGLVEYKRRDYAKAEQHLAESQRLHPHWKTRYWIGKTLTQAGRFDEAEAALLEVLPRHPIARLDLSWLYERKRDYDRAIAQAQAYLEAHPENARASAQLQRLRARTLDAGELLEEAEALAQLGEDIASDVLPEYLDTLLRTGQSSKARDLIEKRINSIDAFVATRLAWTCYFLQAYDVALRLFLKAFPENRSNFKFLNAMEAAADRCGQIQTLIQSYRALAKDDRRLYGRITRLERRLDGSHS